MATSSEGQGHLQQLAKYPNNGLVSFLENLVQINFVDGNNSINKYNSKREALFQLSDNSQVSLIFWWLSLFTVLGNIQHSEQYGAQTLGGHSKASFALILIGGNPLPNPSP
ncbi:hypothetical protein BT96DRAFT_944016 [Gymnopus androsaceus JB14]|uniref:Uncharacterized protein n=1 Tax=Gymnopus androsaceus JB14 TaxID=1447944 RepID=A0A6A4H6D1_9AGAR|nr:hypothetical protein BT96DRAFT_944016 [Gymnopus androsaceus JB14]